MSDPVLAYAGYAQEAERTYGVPANVLLGLIGVESGGNRWAVSGAGAKWSTQFIASTAARYHVTGSSVRSQVMGAAHYLSDLGFAKDPHRALNAYNGAQTISGAPNPYADKVLAVAAKYKHVGGGVSNRPAPAAPAASPSAAGASGGLIDEGKRSDALKALVTVALVGAGSYLSYLGVNTLSGGAVGHAAKAGAMAAAA